VSGARREGRRLRRHRQRRQDLPRRSGKGALFFDAPELEVHALAAGPDGKLYAGTSPDGKVYAIDASGKADTFYDPPDKYIWALAFDKQGNLFVATGAEAKIHRVDKQGKAQVILTSPETHITALAVDSSGGLVAGSAPGGVIYRVDPALKVSVLHDSAFREVKSIATGGDGTIYAAAIDGRSEDTSRPPVTAIPACPGRGRARGFRVRLGGAGSGRPSGFAFAARERRAARPDARGGVAADAERRGRHAVVVERGHAVRARTPARRLASRYGQQRQALPDPGRSQLDDGDDAAGRADHGARRQRRVDDRRAVQPRQGVLARARQCQPRQLRLQGQGLRDQLGMGAPALGSAHAPGTEVQIQTRTGNTGAPDNTWSDWSPAYAQRDGSAVTSGRARFIQLKVALVGKGGATPVLDAVQTAYLQRNQRPSVTSVTVYPPGEVFQRPLAPATGELEILGLEAGQNVDMRPSPQATPRPSLGLSLFGRRLYQRGIQTFSWRGEDPNGDPLVYEVFYRPALESSWRPLRKGLTDAVLAWDTSTVPNGRYVLKIVASDAPGNPEPLALTGDKESEPFDVDNTAPVVQATLAQRAPARVRVLVRDESSLIRKTEWALDGGRWQEIHPLDGINDALEESYDIMPSELTPGPHVLVIRATDSLGNVASARVELAGGR
jgi:hypothetical protein